MQAYMRLLRGGGVGREGICERESKSRVLRQDVRLTSDKALIFVQLLPKLRVIELFPLLIKKQIIGN
jgi:hypothetical protein